MTTAANSTQDLLRRKEPETVCPKCGTLIALDVYSCDACGKFEKLIRQSYEEIVQEGDRL